MGSTPMQGLEAPRPQQPLDAIRTLEPANKAYSLYVSQSPDEKAKLLRLVLSNCAVDAVTFTPLTESLSI